MKKLYFLLLTILMSATSFGQVIITELADPNNNAGARFVELYVVGPNAVDFTDWDLVRYTNAGTTLSSNTVNLTSLGTLQPDSYVLIAANGTNFQTAYGIAADISAGTGGPADSNGDDKIGIRNNMDVIVDIFGTPGVSSNNTNDAMNFEDGRSERVTTVTAPNPTWTATEWDTDNDQGFGAGAQDAPGGFDPGTWIGDPTTCGVALGTATFNCSTNTVGDNNDEVTINIPYTGSDMGITSVTSTVGSVSGDPAMVADGTLTITGQISEGQTWDITLNGGNCDETTISGTVPAAECDPTPSVCFDLSSGSEKFELVAVDTNSDGDVWTETSGVYNMNGFCGGGCSETSDTWLIFGPLNLSGMADFSLSFSATEEFGPSDLNIQYTADYSSGCPSGATWTSAQTITDAGDYNVDLSMAAGTDVFIGIQYFNNDSSFSNWTLSDVTLGSFSGCPQLGQRPTSNCVLCEISLQSEVVNCNTNTAGANNDGITIDIPYTGVDPSITSVTSSSAMVLGSDPSVDMDGTITLANLSEGDSWDVTINGGGCDGTTLSGTVPGTFCNPELQLPFTNNFEYGTVAGDLTAVSAGEWKNHSGTSAVQYSENSLVFTNYDARASFGGSAVLSPSNSEDVNLPFAEQISGKVYMSALVNVSAVNGTNYFWHFNTNAFLGRIGAQSDGGTGINFGIGVAGSPQFGSTSYTLNTTYLLVASFDIATGKADLHVLTAPTGTEPMTPESTDTDAGEIGSAVSSIALRQSSGIANVTIDGIRVAKTWANLALSNNDFENREFSIFPNPTNTGEVTISSVNATPIEVSVFDILGKQVKNETISNNRLNVSNLKSGIYLLRLTQDGATSTKKLVIR